MSAAVAEEVLGLPLSHHFRVVVEHGHGQSPDLADGARQTFDFNGLIVTGTIGDHGMAVMAARHGLDLEGELRSDVAPLNRLIRRVLVEGGEDVVAMKDPTRGGLAAVLTPEHGRHQHHHQPA